MRLLEITLVDQDGCGQKRWTFAGEPNAVIAKIEAMIRASTGHAAASVAYTLAIRSEVFGTLYVDARRHHGPRTEDLQWASRWSDPASAWAWWQKHKGDDTRLVEVVRADTGERVAFGELVAVEGGAA